MEQVKKESPPIPSKRSVKYSAKEVYMHRVTTCRVTLTIFRVGVVASMVIVTTTILRKSSRSSGKASLWTKMKGLVPAIMNPHLMETSKQIRLLKTRKRMKKVKTKTSATRTWTNT